MIVYTFTHLTSQKRLDQTVLADNSCRNHQVYQQQLHFVAFKVITAVDIKSSIFWDIKLCSPVNVNCRFGGT
jgi:hypothetical protein